MTLRHLEVKESRFCTFAVQRDPAALKFVPPELQSEALCQSAAELDPLSVEHIHDEALKEKLLTQLTSTTSDQSRIKTLIRDNPDYFIKLWCLAPRFWNEALLELALDHHAESVMSDLWEFNEPLPEPLLLKALSRDGTLLRYVADANLSLEVCIAAVRQTPDALEFVPPTLVPPNFFEEYMQYAIRNP